MKKYLAAILLLTLVLCSVPTSLAQTEMTFYLSPNGNDYNDGSESAPYRTLRRAGEVARNMRINGKNPDGPITFILKAGEYLLEDSFYLDSSGSNTHYAANGEVVISGGVKIDAQNFKIPDEQTLTRFPESAKANIRYVDLSDYVKSLDSAPDVTSDKMPKSDYIISQGKSYMTAARWPNKGITAKDGFMTVKTVYNSAASGNESVKIGYADERISKWKTPTDISMEGYGSYLFNYQKLRLSEIDSKNKTITTVSEKLSDGFHSGASVWFSNVAEELDIPGEYYLDRTAKKLYFYPVSANESVCISLMDKPLIYLLNAKDISFSGITFCDTRADGISVNGCNNISFDNCSITRTGGYGVKMSRTNQSGVKNSLIFETGSGGVGLFDGGKKYDLTASKNYVLNTEICDFARVKTTYSPAVYTNGIEDTISHNTIHEAFHTAIYFKGNDNVFSHNEIYNVLQGTSDAGAMYVIADASSRRNRIENNFFHHLGDGTTGYQQSGIFAIYFDCMNSGQLVKNNLFYDMPAGIQINGGGYHQIENNIFSHVLVPLYSHKLTNVPNAAFWPYYTELNKNTSLWESKYPELANEVPSDAANNYTGNIFKNNLFSNALSDAANQITAGGITVENTQTDNAEIFVNRKAYDFTLKEQYNNINQIDLNFGVQ